MNKRGACVGVFVAAMLALEGCSGAATTETAAAAGTSEAASAAGETYKIAYTTMTLSSPYFTKVSEGIKDACAERGWECTINDPAMDAGAQLAAIEDFVEHGYDAIIVSAVDSASAADAVKAATEAGVKVIGSSTEIEGEDAFVSAGEYDMGEPLGKALGEWADKNLEGDIEGVTFGTINDPNVMIREKGMREGFEAAYTKGSIKWINEVGTIGGVDSDDGMNNMEAILQSNPNINIVMGSNDAGVLGAYEAAKAAGKDLTKMAFGGVDATDQALDEMKAEKEAGVGAFRCTVDNTPYDHGKIDVDIAGRLLEGEEFDEQVMIECKAVTWDNIDDYFTK